MDPIITTEMHRRVIVASINVVKRVGDDDLSRHTPCTEWRLRELLAHMTGQHRGFAAAAAGAGPDLANWSVGVVTPDPVTAYIGAALRAVAAFSAPGVLENSLWLPEISTTQPYPGRVAIGFHLVDYVVHSWDVARSIDVEFQVDDDLGEAAFQVARRVPDGAARMEPGSMFLPSIPIADTADILDRTVALLGRPPSWSATTA